MPRTLRTCLLSQTLLQVAAPVVVMIDVTETIPSIVTKRRPTITADLRLPGQSFRVCTQIMSLQGIYKKLGKVYFWRAAYQQLKYKIIKHHLATEHGPQPYDHWLYLVRKEVDQDHQEAHICGF